MTQLDEPGRNKSMGRRHVKLVIPLAQVDTDGDGRVTVRIPYLRNIRGAKIDAQPFLSQPPS